jgi:hypothetical protein
MYCLATSTRNVTLPSPMFGFSTGAAGDGTDGSHSERTARLMVLCVRMICNIDIDGNRKSTCSGAEDEQRGHVALLLGVLAAGFVWTPV